MTREEAAEKLKISVRQLDRLLDECAIPTMQLNSSVRIRWRDLEQWMEQMAKPLSLKRTALFLSLTPESVIKLATEAGLKHERDGNEYRFFKPLLEKWRKGFEGDDLIFGSIDDRARSLQEALAQKGIQVDLLLCELCSAASRSFAASRACTLCGRPICLPHGLHYLKRRKRPDVACDECVEKYAPPVL